MNQTRAISYPNGYLKSYRCFLSIYVYALINRVSLSILQRNIYHLSTKVLVYSKLPQFSQAKHLANTVTHASNCLGPDSILQARYERYHVLPRNPPLLTVGHALRYKYLPVRLCSTEELFISEWNQYCETD